MLTTVYIEDKNGDFISCNGEKRYTRLYGEALRDYLTSSIGKDTRFYEENGVGVEIPSNLISDFRKDERRKQYMSDVEKVSPYFCVSLSSFSDTELSGEEAISDESQDVPEIVFRNTAIESMRRAMLLLTEKEQFIINALYFNDPKITQAQIGEILGITQQAISRQVSKILHKLRALITHPKY